MQNKSSVIYFGENVLKGRRRLRISAKKTFPKNGLRQTAAGMSRPNR
jgi:hypothetical protein